MAELHHSARRAVWAVFRIVDDHRCAPIARFLRLDGDRAILTRVLQFLLGANEPAISANEPAITALE